MQLGIGSWTFPWAVGVTGYPAPEKPLGIFDLLKIAQTFEVNVVQICDNLPLHSLDSSTLKAFAQNASRQNITIEVGTRGVEPDHLLKYLEIANILNAQILRTIIHSSSSTPDLSQATEWFQEVLPQFAEAELTLVIENHERHKAKELAGFIKKINHPKLGICLDTVNSFGALEGPEAVLKGLGPYVKICILKSLKSPELIIRWVLLLPALLPVTAN